MAEVRLSSLSPDGESERAAIRQALVTEYGPARQLDDRGEVTDLWSVNDRHVVLLPEHSESVAVWVYDPELIDYEAD